MRSRFALKLRAAVIAAAATTPLLAACGTEDASDAGGPLLPGGAVRTFEVLIEPDRFFIRDTAFSGYAEPFDVTYMILADDFGGQVNANALARLTIPLTIQAPDSGGTTRTDTVPVFFGGTVDLHIDSVTASASELLLELYRVAEEWDPESATWLLRVDTADTQLPWTEPGGTRGVLIDTATWTSPDSIVSFDVDSATIEAWRDREDPSRGAFLRVAGAGERIRASEIVLHVDARPSFRPDTVVTTEVRSPNRTFVYDPPIDTLSADPRVGGITAWRTFLRLRERLDSLRVPCPSGPPGCMLTLRETQINYAALVLEPVTPPAGFVPEDSIHLVAPIIVESPSVPLLRSLIAGEAGRALDPIPPERLAGPGEPIEVVITEYVRQVVSDTSATPLVPPTIGLITAIQSETFGFAAFEPRPRLRLVLSVASELLLR